MCINNTVTKKECINVYSRMKGVLRKHVPFTQDSIILRSGKGLYSQQRDPI